MKNHFFAIATAALFAGCSSGTDESTSSSSKSLTTVEMVTSMGTIRIELDFKRAPITADNFADYVNAKHYDGTVFHRVIADFMIQGGGFAPDGDGIPEERATRNAIQNESNNGLSNARGTIAMARTNDPNSATAQFFINVKDNASLNPQPPRAGYAVFGTVTAGMDVVDKIRGVKTGQGMLKSIVPGGNLRSGPHGDVPITPVVITSARMVE